jgi:hypothetical protein
MAGGTGADSAALAIGHGERDGDEDPGIAVLDKLVEIRPPFSPETVVRQFAAVLREYRIDEVSGDAFGGGIVADMFRRHGIRYEVTPRSKSELYAQFLVGLNSSRAILLDEPRLLAQLQALQRRASPGGKDTIDHASGRGAHDDAANVVAGLLAAILDEAGQDQLIVGVLR